MNAVKGLAAAVTLLVSISACGLTHTHPSDLPGELASLELDRGSFRAVGEDRRFGSEDCIMGDCPRLVRYYASPLSPSEACRRAVPTLKAWFPALRSQPTVRTPAACILAGSRGSTYVYVHVLADITMEARPTDLGDEPITIPHRSVIELQLSKG